MKLPNALSAVGRFLLEEDGPTAVEYAVMLALIVVACVGSVMLLADRTNESFKTSGDAIDGAFNP
ncbi:Flp family type IVb pilin [Roseimaritima sediminicola]|uniref:Flp family type IVb pilin n=1 Tax=Roseimaritima sediminicola TaxID=2662066 RepID=UPI0012984594|nr:Flp family type IVb pilin [Roseimaritima sediminicola]